jgi:ParB-like chromosome segregation protein Spo0J
VTYATALDTGGAPRAALQPDVVMVDVEDLAITPSFRESGVTHEHVAHLIAMRGHWPPILVGRTDGLVIDGVHRVAAARFLGLARIEAVIFDGGPEEALIEFVRRNVYHGLPLTLGERKRAAARILVVQPAWSDRRVAELCAISPKTVARLRPRAGHRPTEETPQLDIPTRIGRDNKCRPVDGASARSRIVDEIKARPEASLRAIAATVGVSPETVRSVRMSLQSAPDLGAPPTRIEAPWNDDAAILSSDGGEDFVAWFDRTVVTDDDARRRLDAVPLSRIYEIADEARRRSTVWMQFARALEARSKASR